MASCHDERHISQFPILSFHTDSSSGSAETLGIALTHSYGNRCTVHRVDIDKAWTNAFHLLQNNAWAASPKTDVSKVKKKPLLTFLMHAPALIVKDLFSDSLHSELNSIPFQLNNSTGIQTEYRIAIYIFIWMQYISI